MSKAVKKVGKSLKKVVDGVSGGVSKLWEKAKGSKFIRIVAIAGAVYLTAGAALGALGMGAAATAGAGGTALTGMSGAMAGLSSAWGGITGAAGAVASGNIAGAGSSLSTGLLGGTTAAGSVASTATALPSAIGSTAEVGYAPLASGSSNLTFAAKSAGDIAATATGLPQVTIAANNAASAGGGLLETAGKAWNSLGDYGKFATINMAGNAMSGYAQQKAAEDQANDQERLRRGELDRYRRNAWQIG